MLFKNEDGGVRGSKYSQNARHVKLFYPLSIFLSGYCVFYLIVMRKNKRVISKIKAFKKSKQIVIFFLTITKPFFSKYNTVVKVPRRTSYQ